MPLCLNLLKENPIAGESYEGEVAVALCAVRRWYWAMNPDQLTQLFAILEPAFVRYGEDELKPELIKN